MHLRYSESNNQSRRDLEQTDWEMQHLEEIELSQIADKFSSSFPNGRSQAVNHSNDMEASNR